MTHETLKQDLRLFAGRVDKYLADALCPDGRIPRQVWEAMEYSTMGGGKRIRPYLTMKFAAMLGGSEEIALPFGAALEMVHTYSLIHDDLPCMDDDDYRRGKPTCHKMYGEANAVLAGDGLLTLAFGVLADAPATPEQIVRATRLLSEAAGCNGMIGGQVLDLLAENTTVSRQSLCRIHDGKTCALMRAAAGLGCIAAGVFEGEAWDAAMTYATEVGMAFQIVDDLLDVYGTDAIGKPVGSDSRNGKTTYLTFMTADEARAEASVRTQKAIQALGGMDADGCLAALAEMLLGRTK